MSVVKDFLRMAGIDLTPAPLPPDPRDELKRLRLETAAARRRHEAEIEVVRRLQSLGSIADQLEQEAQAAEVAAGAAVGEWARGETESVGNSELFGRAEAARSRAVRARIAATGAEKQLTARDWDSQGAPNGPYTTPEELEARHALRNAESAEQQGRRPIIESLIEPTLAEFEALMLQVRELDKELQAFDCYAGYNTGHSFGGFRARYSAARRLGATPANNDERSRLRLPWMRFDSKLKSDPDSKFDV